MSFEEIINADLKAAMIAKDEVKKLTIRDIKKNIIEARTAPGADGKVDDAMVLKILTKLHKQRKESADLYVKQGREDLAEKEMAEAAVIEKYLPKSLSDEELEVEIKAVIEKTGAAGPKDMGKVMGVASKSLAGKAEGKAIAAKVKELLSKMN